MIYDWDAIDDLSKEKRVMEEEALWLAAHPRLPDDPSLPKSHCLKCGFAIDIVRVENTLAFFQPGRTEFHSCKIKPRLQFGRVSPKKATTLKIGGRRVDV